MSADSAAWKDLMGDDLQMRIIRDGEEPSGEEGDIGDSLNIEFSGFRLDDFHGDVENVFKVVTPFINKKECMITLGEGDVVPGLEMAARRNTAAPRRCPRQHSQSSARSSIRSALL